MSDTIYALPGATFFSELDNAATGLVGTLGVRIIRKTDEAEVLGRTTAGIVESPAGSGRYVATLEAPKTEGDYTVLWDTGTVSPTTTASDDLRVTSSIAALIEPPEPGPGRIAYASYSDIQAHLSFIPTFTATSKPNATQAHSLLVDASNQLDAALAVADYSVPIPSTATVALELLRSWTGIGAAAKVAWAMPQGKDSKHAEALGAEWEVILGRVRDSEASLPGLDKNQSTALVRSGGEEAGGIGASPTFTREYIER